MPDLQTEIPAVPVLVPLAAVLLLAAWLTMRDRLLPAVAGALYLTGVVAVTLLPLQIATGLYANQVPWYEKASYIPIITIDLRTFVLNIVMLLPFGFLLPMLRRIDSVKQIAWLSLAFSATVELIQFATNVLVSSGRTPDVNDLLANTLGGVLGFLAWRTARRALKPAMSS
ncbi:VanZ family protein [Actinoplanes sp. G11-F43]|uniref:VanZ family protein n=1 Tax=Actinoplanes sp. G11-F43 TaxID=3424130 RepID=UPI003D33EF65